MWKGKGAPEWPKAPHLFLFQECSSRCAWEGGNPRREPGCPGVEHSEDSAEGPSPTPSAPGVSSWWLLPCQLHGALVVGRAWGSHRGGGVVPRDWEVHPEPCPLM